MYALTASLYTHNSAKAGCKISVRPATNQMKKISTFLLLFLSAIVLAQKTERFTPFLPKGYTVYDQVYGDLDKDGTKDCILVIKATDKSKVVKDEHRGLLDRNRRGIIVLFNKNNKYVLAAKNYSCFSSENEDGGVYYPPELSVEINKGSLYIHYAHGRYGYWHYQFKYLNGDFKLIGYESSSNNGPITNKETSINFLTKRKLTKTNTNENTEEEGDEVFKESWANIKQQKPIKLSEVKDFDALNLDF